MGPVPIDETIERLEQLVREYAERPIALAGIQGSLARALATRVDLQAARDLQDAEDIYLEAGMELEATSVYWTRAWVAQCAGDFAEEEHQLREMVARLEELNDRAYLSTHWMQLGLCLVGRGKDEEAQQALERSREVTSPDDVVDVVGLDALEGVLRARRGELGEAQELTNRALARADEADHIGLQLDTRWGAAEVFERAGRADKARALLDESVGIAERYGHLVAAQRARDRLVALG